MLDVYGGPYHLPPVISGHNAFWLWGPGDAHDTTVLYVDAAGQLNPYFASCRQLAVYNLPDQVNNDWNDLAIGVCTGPSGSWGTEPAGAPSNPAGVTISRGYALYVFRCPASYEHPPATVMQ